MRPNGSRNPHKQFRRKKIIANEKITDASIDNVPLIQFSTLSKIESANIQRIERGLLKYVRNNHNNEECALVYRLDKENFASWTDRLSEPINGDMQTVEVGNHPLVLSAISVAVVITHNHPNNSPISIEDIALFMKINSVRILTAVGHDGHVSAIERTPSYDAQDAYDYFTDLLRNEADFTDEMLRSPSRGKYRNIDPVIRLKITNDWIQKQFREGNIDFKEKRGILYESAYEKRGEKLSKNHSRRMDRGGR